MPNGELGWEAGEMIAGIEKETDYAVDRHGRSGISNVIMAGIMSYTRPCAQRNERVRLKF